MLKSFEKVDPSKASSIEASLHLCIADIFFFSMLVVDQHVDICRGSWVGQPGRG